MYVTDALTGAQFLETPEAIDTLEPHWHDAAIARVRGTGFSKSAAATAHGPPRLRPGLPPFSDRILPQITVAVRHDLPPHASSPCGALAGAHPVRRPATARAQ